MTTSQATAETSKPVSRLIAVLVDQPLYDAFATPINRYASKYLQAQYSDAKALIIPIKSENFQAQDIHKMLQNLYFEGQQDTPSELIGVTLIGNIALPVVNDSGYHYPTIYPYIDFLDPQFVFSEQENIFIANTQGVSHDPELRHNLIRFDTLPEYEKFFKKLAGYAARPVARVSDKIWVDDFVQGQQSYDQGLLKNYANQFVFAEDIGRQRYTNLLTDLTNGQEADKAFDIFRDGGSIKIDPPANNSDDIPDDLAQQQGETAQNLKGYFTWITQLSRLLGKKKPNDPNTFDTAKVAGLSSSQAIPTLFNQQIMDGYLKTYPQLYSEEYHTTINNLIEPSGRYYNSGDRVGINSHIRKTYQQDELAKTIIINLNDQLEAAADNLIESEKMYMTVPVPTKVLNYRPPTANKCATTRKLILDEVYDVSYFGSDPGTSVNIQDMMIFRGTFNNLVTAKELEGYNYLWRSPYISDDGSDKLTASVGTSYGFQSREVEANRGYNPMLVEQDMDTFADMKPKILAGTNECRPGQLEDFERYIQWFWGGYTPLNLLEEKVVENGRLQLDIKKLDHTQIRSPSFAVNGAVFGGTAYDIAGSRALTKSRTLNVTEGTQELTMGYTPNPDWVAPDQCDGLIESQGGIVSQYAAAEQNYEENCSGTDPVESDPRICELDRQNLQTLAGEIDAFRQDPANQELIDNCTQDIDSYIIVTEAISKQPIKLEGISDNYLSYLNFAATQKTSNRPPFADSLTRYYSPKVVNNLYRYKGQDGLNYSIADAIQNKSIKPFLYCDGDKKKQKIQFKEVEFFRNINREPINGEKIRMMISPVGGDPNAILSDKKLAEQDALAISCAKIYDQIDELEAEQRKRKREWYVAISPVIAIYRFITSKKRDIENLEKSNQKCFDNDESIFQYINANDKQCSGKRYSMMLDYFYETMPSVYKHKAPTAEDLYGKELTTLRGVQNQYAYPNPDQMRGNDRRRRFMLEGYKFDGLKVEVDSISFILIPGNSNDFTFSEDETKIYFTNTASLPLYGKDVSLKGTMGIFTNVGTIILTGTDAPLSRGEQEAGGRAPFKYQRYGGMNVGTSERPIDSVRYTSFQGIGGDLVKLVYPNLYNVSVFSSTGVLHTEEVIREKIKEYLVLQASIYRDTLAAQLEKSGGFFQTQAKGFTYLAKSDPYASPVNRPGYDLSKITDDFFINGLTVTVGAKSYSSEDVLTILARNLYYQNLISPVKDASSILDEQLNNIYTTIGLDNINSKRKFTLETYLQTDSDLTKAGVPRIQAWKDLGQLLIPSYDKAGYEITAITSNGSDYHIDQTLNPTLRQFTLTSDTTAAAPRQETNDAQLAPLVCNGKTYDWKGVSILQYPKAFQCWLEDIKTNSITITVNGELVDIIENIDQGGRKVALTGYFADQLSYVNQLLDFPVETLQLGEGVVNAYGKLINDAFSGQTKPVNFGAEQYQKRRGRVASSTGLQLLKNDPLYNPTAMTDAERILSKIVNNLTIDTAGSQLAMDSTGVLVLSTINKTPIFDISITGTGSACLTLDGINTCAQPVNIAGRGEQVSHDADFVIGVAGGGKIGDAALIAKICSQGTTTCIDYPIIYRIIPGKIAKVKFIDILQESYLARGSQIPLIIQGFDREDLILTTAPDPYRITTTVGKLVYMSQTTDGVDVNTWKDLAMIYDSTDVPKGTTSERIFVSPQYPDELLPVFDFTIKLTEPKLELSTASGPTPLDKGFAIQLPSAPNTLTSLLPNGETSLVPGKIPKIRLGLTPVDGKPVLGMIRISSQNGLVRPGVIGTRTISGSNNNTYVQNIWSDQDTFVITGSSQEIYLFPSYRAGKDTIQVTIGDSLWSIPVEVVAGEPAGVVIKAPERLELNQTGNIDLSITDYRGNRLTSDGWIDLTTYGYALTLLDNGEEVSRNSFKAIDGVLASKGSAQLKIVPKAIIGKGYVTAEIRGIPTASQRSDYVGILVQSILWPVKRLNTLVLQLKGNDRGNIINYQTDTKLKAPILISESDKLLSVVTDLVNPRIIKETQLILNPNGALGGPQANSTTLALGQGSWNISTSQGITLTLGTAKGYTMLESDSAILTNKPEITTPHLYYIPLLKDSIISSNQVANNVLLINDQAMLNLNALLMHPDITMRYLRNTTYGAGIYDVIYRSRVVGQMVMYRPDSLLLRDVEVLKLQVSDIYDVLIGYAGGSTKGGQAVHIVTRDSAYQSDYVPTPQNSLIAQFGQGLSVGDATKLYDQFSITFGDAALSRSTVNVEAYAMVSDQGMEVTQKIPYDTGIGQMIYHDPAKPIDRVVSIDFNNDKLKDLLIVYEDGSVRMLKNYGGKQPRRDLGHLMIIADGIQDLYAGDVDKNGYQDIIVYTQEGKLRVYYNRRGVFDVDGFPVCLDVAGGPDNLSQLYYRTIRDMDLDGAIDITTYDYFGDIKIFYGGGGGTDRGSSYVSADHDLCDGGWKSRQQSKTVQSLGLNLLSGPIQDESMLHRASHVNSNNPYDQPAVDRKLPGYYQEYDQLSELENSAMPTLNTADEASAAGISPNVDFTSKLPKDAKSYRSKQFADTVADMVVSNFDVTQSVNTAYADATRYTPLPDTLRPIYQTKGSTLYLNTTKITPFDPFGASKVFEDMNGGVLIDRDLIRITVKIRGVAGTQFSYLDRLTGPWVVPLSEAGQLEGMSDSFATYVNYITFNREGYIFAANGLTMEGDGEIEFSYVVQYRSEQLAEVKVVPVPGTFPLITATALDGCQKAQWIHTNLGSDGNRNYKTDLLDFKAIILRDQTLSYSVYDKAVATQTQQIVQSMGEEDGPMDYIKERWNNDNVFQRALGIVDGTYLESIPTNFRLGLETISKEREVNNKITNITNGLCNGFKRNSASCAGVTPPVGVPFNMAFPPLTPGVVNAMGYGILYDRGLPLFAFPTKGPIPIRPPNPAGAGGWLSVQKPVRYRQIKAAGALQNNSAINGALASAPIKPISQFRFYATPTLTSAFGFAFCFGPYGVGTKLPAPFKNVIGNCIVMATQPKLKGQRQCVVESKPEYTPPPELDLPACYGDLQTNLSKISPTQMITLDSRSIAWMEQQRLTSPSDGYGLASWDVFARSNEGVSQAFQAFQGVIHLNRPARMMRTTEVFGIRGYSDGQGIDLSTITTKFQEFTNLDKPQRKLKEREIGRGIIKGIGACVMKIADNQIQYAKNNLLTSSLTVVLPDLTRLGVSNNRNDARIWTDGGEIKQNRKDINLSLNNASNKTAENMAIYEGSAANPTTQDSILSNVSSTQVNPFYAIEQLFNDIELIKISHRTIWLDIPFIRTADLNLYRTQLMGWKERNQEIVEQRKSYQVELVAKCAKAETKDKQDCEELLKQVIYVNNKYGQLMRSYQANRAVINQYVHFQTILLPQRKENQLMYLKEIINVINSTMAQLAGRSTQNSARFTAWTSAIRSMIVAVKTRQLLIDFATNRKERCGTCRTDNYDFATCSLNGLCPNFPLFSWPNFRTPDFTIDLSSIDAGVDVVIPEVRFRPVDVPLFKLVEIPDLPLPPPISSPVYAKINIILPTLPVLPEPPELPSLPSLSMRVDMDLPLLPPAPKIPMLPETLNAAVQVATFIGRILCVVKGDIGLVGESFVKQKIEQITARTWSVGPFDTISAVVSQPRPQGYNARLDAYVNLRYYFDGLYSVFDELGSQRNVNAVGNLQRGFSRAANQSATYLNSAIDDSKAAVADTLDEKLRVRIGTPPYRFEQTARPLGHAEFDQRLTATLKQFAMDVDNPAVADQATRIIAMIQQPIQSKPNLEALSEINNQSQSIMSEAIQQAQSEYNLIKYNYDERLETLVSDQYVSNKTQETVLSSSLFTINPDVAEMIQSSDITKDYLQGNKELLTRYQNALANQSPNALNTDPNTHLEMKQYVDTMLAMTTQTLQDYDQYAQRPDRSPTGEGRTSPYNNNTDPDSPNPSPSTTNTSSSSSISSSSSSKSYDLIGFDQTNKRDGYLVDVGIKVSNGYAKAAVDIIKPEPLGTQYRENSFEQDLNDDYVFSPDIVLRDSDSVYVKYAIQNPIHKSHVKNGRLYVLPALESPAQLARISEAYEGYVSFDPGILERSMWFKLRSSSYALSNFHLQGQEYDNAVFQWTNPSDLGQSRNEIYLLRVTNRVDNHPDNASSSDSTQYVMVMPAGMQIDPQETQIKIPGLNTSSLQDLIEDKIIHDVVNFSPDDDMIVGLLRNLGRAWYYAQGLRMELIDGVFTRTSPWSNQDVGGYQIAADSVAPTPEAKLIRVSTSEEVGGGSSMQGYINTVYDLVVTWTDNVSISRSSVGGITKPRATRTEVKRIYEQLPTTLNYSFSAADSNENITTLNIAVKIQNPDLETVSATATDGSRGTITAELSPDLDDGIIQFQQDNNNTRSTLTARPGGERGYQVEPFKTIFTGGLYQFPNSRGLKNADGGDVGTINDAGQINSDELQMLVRFPQGYPVISMVDPKGAIRYELIYASLGLTGALIDIKTPSQYRLLSLENFNNAIIGKFAGGSCIAPQLGECEIYISPRGDVWIDPTAQQYYYGTYLWRNGHGVYQIIRDKVFVAEIHFIPDMIQ